MKWISKLNAKDQGVGRTGAPDGILDLTASCHIYVTDQMIGPDDLTKDRMKGGKSANQLWLDWLACETVETKTTLVGTTNQFIYWLDWLALETVETSSI